MTQHRCGHFRLDVEEIFIPLVPVSLRVPVRRCLLAERMIVLISSDAGGREIARKLVVSSSGGEASAAFDPSLVRAAFGPDLEAIHAAECTSDRCQSSCVPGFRLLLEQFGFAELAASEEVTDCMGAPIEASAL